MRLPGGLVLGTFTHRRNRFAAGVLVDGQACVAHVPNSGRMTELLVCGAPVMLEPAPSSPARRTAFTLALVEYEGRWVGVDSRMPPALVVEAWRKGLLPSLSRYPKVEREVRYGESRLDLRFEGVEGHCYVEAKSVNLVVDGVALFPDAPTVRGAKHLGELARAAGQGHGAAVVFVVQRDDATALAPHVAADPHFADQLRRAASRGVGVYGISCSVTSRAVTPVRQLPVVLDHQARTSRGPA